MFEAGSKDGQAVDELFAAFDSGAHADALDVLLGHLQGNGPQMQADAGLARLSPPRLAVIQQGARLRAEGCLEALRCTAQLLAQALEEVPAPPEATRALVGSAHLLGRLADDLQRWLLLAEHAGVYRAQPDVADQVCRRWGQWCRQSGEWPDGLVE